MNYKDKRIKIILDVLVKFIQKNFSVEIPISSKGDELDAIALGLNTLAEELSWYIHEMEERKNQDEINHTALLNILEDLAEEKRYLENTHSAMLNILEDYSYQSKLTKNINKDLINANKELDQFAYVASHDLQQPLRTISNFVNLLKEKHATKTDPETAHYISLIVNATSKMQNLIKVLLDFSRIGTDRLFTTVDCKKVLNEVIEQMQTSIKETNTIITSSILPVVKGNEIGLNQLFQNLISNAIKFRKKNVQNKIEIIVEQKETKYLFSFKDNGIGFEEQYKERVFIIFQRLHPVSEYEGTGIGLATCKKIVTQHNGKIWVKSKLNKGSTFYFTISKKN